MLYEYALNIHCHYFIVSKKEELCSFVRMWAGAGMYDMVQRFLQLEDLDLFQHLSYIILKKTYWFFIVSFWALLILKLAKSAIVREKN